MKRILPFSLMAALVLLPTGFSIAQEDTGSEIPVHVTTEGGWSRPDEGPRTPDVNAAPAVNTEEIAPAAFEPVQPVQPVPARKPAAPSRKLTQEELDRSVKIRTMTKKVDLSSTDIDDETMIDLLELKDIDVRDVLKLISAKTGLNIVAGDDTKGRVTLYLKDVKLKDAFRIILDTNNLAYRLEDGIVRVMPAAQFEQRFGYKFGGNVQTRIIQMAYADVTDTLQLFNQIKSPSGKIIADPKSRTLVVMDSPEKIKLIENLVQQVDVPMENKVFELTYAPVKDVASKVSERSTKNVGTVSFDERTNRLMVHDTPAKLKEISELIDLFDVKRREVLIEAKIVQVELTDQFQLGVDWQAILRQRHGLTFTSNFDILQDSDKRGEVMIGDIDEDDYTAMVQALKTIGNTRLLSSPRISVINNEEAKILVGTQEAYVTTTTTIPASGQQVNAENVNFIDVGVKLYVTPTIHKDDFITMKIRPEVSSVSRFVETSDNNTIPVKQSSEAETTVMVKDGATVVIGGLIKDEVTDSTSKVPLLGDIPVMGAAFRNKNHDVTKTEIVIFLTPRIITGESSYGADARVSPAIAAAANP